MLVSFPIMVSSAITRFPHPREPARASIWLSGSRQPTADLAGALLAAIAGHIIRARRRRCEIVLLPRLRFSSFEVFAQCQFQAFLTLVLGHLANRPPALVAVILHR